MRDQAMAMRLSKLYECKKNTIDKIDQIKGCGISSRSYLNYSDFKLALAYCSREIKETEWLLRKLIESRNELRQ